MQNSLGIFAFILIIVSCLFQKSVSSSYSYDIKFFDTKLDHFNFNTNQTFKLRYLVNDTFWNGKAKSPIFFYAGNEGDITLFAENTGFMWEIAPEFKARLVFAEHRYYGKTLPFGNQSREASHLGYLSSSQALMDYVELLDHVKGKFKNQPVVVFGGSYGGMLAAWMRIKYPASVVGAIASSAPIWQFTGMTPCNAFNQVLTSAFTLEGKACSDNIRKSWGAINEITKTEEGKTWLSNTWKVCSPIKSQQNVTDFKNYLIDVYGNLAMVNYPYPSEFLAPLPGYPVKAVCSFLQDDKLKGKQLLTALSFAVSVYFNYTGETKCLDYSDSYDESLDDSLWNYQACTEMVMPMCTDGKHDMFEPAEWNLEEYVSSCRQQYGVQAQANLVKNLYGGKDIGTATNIIFSNGLLDPWSSGGVMRDVSQSAQALVIPESAHHLDLRASNPLDPNSVVLARQYYRTVINSWIKQ